ncbi:MAG: hypothetical protein AB1585_18960 [Thermodesulfobacteriota bacterium]
MGYYIDIRNILRVFPCFFKISGHSALMGKVKRDWQEVEYVIKMVLRRVSALFPMKKDYITSKGRQRDRVRARDLLCFWSANELGISMVDLARRFEVTSAAVSCAVRRGEKMALEKNYRLEE